MSLRAGVDNSLLIYEKKYSFVFEVSIHYFFSQIEKEHEKLPTSSRGALDFDHVSKKCAFGHSTN